MSGFHTYFVVQGDMNGKVECFPKPQCQKFGRESLQIMLTFDLYLVVISVKTTSRHYLDEEVLENCERSLGNPWRVKMVYCIFCNRKVGSDRWCRMQSSQQKLLL